MSNEITKKQTLLWTKNGARVGFDASETVDQIGNASFADVQIIDTTSAALSLGAVDSEAHVGFMNLNTAWSKLPLAIQATFTGDTLAQKKADYESKNMVYVSAINPAVKATATYNIPPGGSAGGSLTTQLLWYAIADTEDVNLFVGAIEK